MLRDVDWSVDKTYQTDGDRQPLQFYLDALKHSTHLDLLLGYFSSAAISVLSLGFAKFLSSGGTVRMIVNDILSELDKATVKKGYESPTSSNFYGITDIQKLRETLDEYGTHFFECLAWLIANQRMEIKVVRPKTGNGISHYKSGVFSDGRDHVCFKGSCNFTAFGLLENLEEITCFLGWEDARSALEVSNQNKRFEKIIQGKADNVIFVDVDAIRLAIKNCFGSKDINELIIQEKELLEKKKSVYGNKNIRKFLNKAEEDLREYIRQPRFPYAEGPREYQIQAYNNWVANGYKGIFAMATGTGKTITSLNCLLNEYKNNGSYKAIILVPTIALLSQWKKECQKFNFRNIITVSSKENWSQNISFFNTASTFIDTSFIIIVTYASLTRPKFRTHFNLLPNDTLLIADETHNMGSPSLQRFLPVVHLNKRIGLSATPNRQYDESGNSIVRTFFNDAPPFTFSYTMKSAMENKPPALCRYLYYPHVVFLNDEELLEYMRISKRLLTYIDTITGKYKDCQEVEYLLLARKRIIHKAKNKKPTFQKILECEFQKKGHLKYTIVYVPEGFDVDYSHTDEYIEDTDENRLINEYTRAVSETSPSIMVRQYTGSTMNREQIITEFEQGKVHVLTSMKCLDEGVDVPRAELAIFCSSTGNPRQFIQRRGRVLRLHSEKLLSVIHDLVVVPQINESECNFEMERNLVKKELERVVDFSELSMNKLDTYLALKDVLDYYNLNLNDFNNI